MPVTNAQKAAAEQVIEAIKGVASPRKKRVLAELFLELVDKGTWADYYQVPFQTLILLSVASVHHPCQVIPKPNSLNGISQKLQDGAYKDPLEIYEDLSLVFWNALYYNEPASQIYKDAETLKVRCHLTSSSWLQSSQILSHADRF
jgi:chromatin structure-remodeling complex subunit RSC1/2